MIKTESTARPMFSFKFAPTNIREMLQQNSRKTAAKAVEAVVDMSINGFDGRYANRFPSETIRMENGDGEFFHVVGSSVSGDLSVAAE